MTRRATNTPISINPTTPFRVSTSGNWSSAPQNLPVGGQSRQRPATNTRRKRWVAAASCVGLVAAASGGGLLVELRVHVRVSAEDAAARFASLIADGKYEEAFSLTDGSNPFHTDGFSTDLLTDRAHTGAPQVSDVSTQASSTSSEWFDTTFVYDDSSEPDTLSFSLRSTERRNGSLGMWQADFGGGDSKRFFLRHARRACG